MESATNGSDSFEKVLRTLYTSNDAQLDCTFLFLKLYLAGLRYLNGYTKMVVPQNPAPNPAVALLHTLPKGFKTCTMALLEFEKQKQASHPLESAALRSIASSIRRVITLNGFHFGKRHRDLHFAKKSFSTSMTSI